MLIFSSFREVVEVNVMFAQFRKVEFVTSNESKESISKVF